MVAGAVILEPLATALKPVELVFATGWKGLPGTTLALVVVGALLQALPDTPVLCTTD